VCTHWKIPIIEGHGKNVVENNGENNQKVEKTNQTIIQMLPQG